MPPSGAITLSWGNDGLNYLAPGDGLRAGHFFHDDDGFTNDLSLSAVLQRSLGKVEALIRHRMITERGGMHRVDEFLSELRWEALARRLGQGKAFAYLGLGMMATGNLGGSALQDSFHHLIHWGRYLENQGEAKLQNLYEGGTRFGPRLVVGGRVTHPLSKQTTALAGIEVNVSHGVGVSSGEVSGALERDWSYGKNHFSLWGKLALRHLHSEEERLSFHGGYPLEKTFFEGACGFSYARGAKAVSFSLILDQEGTGANQGILSLSYLLGE